MPVDEVPEHCPLCGNELAHDAEEEVEDDPDEEPRVVRGLVLLMGGPDLDPAE